MTKRVDRLDFGYNLAGEENRQSKLTWKKVRLIRSIGSGPCNRQKLAEQFGVNVSVIHRILRNEMWKHDPGETHE